MKATVLTIGLFAAIASARADDLGTTLKRFVLQRGTGITREAMATRYSARFVNDEDQVRALVTYTEQPHTVGVVKILLIDSTDGLASVRALVDVGGDGTLDYITTAQSTTLTGAYRAIDRAIAQPPTPDDRTLYATYVSRILNPAPTQ